MYPIEWLRGLDETRDGYTRLLSESGSLARAAWRLAQARCQVNRTPTQVPTRLELRAAARKISRKAGAGPVPKVAFLANECEAEGLLVI
jgi:hypothetical protein